MWSHALLMELTSWPVVQTQTHSHTPDCKNTESFRCTVNSLWDGQGFRRDEESDREVRRVHFHSQLFLWHHLSLLTPGPWPEVAVYGHSGGSSHLGKCQGHGMTTKTNKTDETATYQRMKVKCMLHHKLWNYSHENMFQEVLNIKSDSTSLHLHTVFFWREMSIMADSSRTKVTGEMGACDWKRE